MIDYFFLFTNQSAAQTDATVGSYFVNGAWLGNCVFPGLTFISSQALSGYMLMISKNDADSSLANHPQCILSLDRDKAVTGGPFVISSPGLTTNGRTSLVFFPVPFGSRYPKPLGQ